MELNLKRKNTSYLLAMSAGIDSTALFYLLLEEKIDFYVAHANFNLRGEDSERDAVFVESLCKRYNVPYYIAHLDVTDYKKHHNASTQMAARVLRYAWFDELLKTNAIDFLLTAHHLNDSMETFMLNLSRGTGINGLTGIENYNNVLRPLAKYTRSDIENYVSNKGIDYRHDVTNDTDDYKRNYVRHHITPEFFELNNQFDQAFKMTLEHLQNDRDLIADYVDVLLREISSQKGNEIYFDIKNLKRPNIKRAFFHIFSRYGFMYPIEIEKLLDAQNSAEITSEKFRLIKDRTSIILAPLLQNKTEYKIIDLNTEGLPIDYKLIKSDVPKNGMVSFDFNKVKFPLSLRIHKSGDKFYPKGMNGKSKKISKFYKDLKLSKVEKEHTWLLCDANDNIIWVVGHRQDERFVPTKNTKIWLIVEN